MAVQDSELGGKVRLGAELWDRGQLNQHRCDDHTKVRLKSEIPDKKNRDMKYLKLVYCSC